MPGEGCKGGCGAAGGVAKCCRVPRLWLLASCRPWPRTLPLAWPRSHLAALARHLIFVCIALLPYTFCQVIGHFGFPDTGPSCCRTLWFSQLRNISNPEIMKTTKTRTTEQH